MHNLKLECRATTSSLFKFRPCKLATVPLDLARCTLKSGASISEKQKSIPRIGILFLTLSLGPARMAMGKYGSVLGNAVFRILTTSPMPVSGYPCQLEEGRGIYWTRCCRSCQPSWTIQPDWLGSFRGQRFRNYLSLSLKRELSV